jgi:CspA family cold shock protein
MTTGTVRWVNESKGFGLITPARGSNDLFARFWALPATISSKAVKPKQRVSFDVMTSLDGDEAVNIKMLL